MLSRSAAILLASCLSTLPAFAQSDFSSCVAGLRSAALAKGVSAETFATATRGLTPDMKVIELMNNQPEFKTPIWDYLATLVDDEKVAEGQAMLRRHAATLAAAESRFGVDRHTIVAVWGVESDFGKSGGTMPLVQALATGACLAPADKASSGTSSCRRCASSSAATFKPRTSRVPGRAPSGTRSSSPRPISAWRWTATATAGATS
jgi:membrane-bound lytic murein transglycosylase B